MNESSASVRYEQRDAVALLTLNRPEALNAFNEALRVQLGQALARAAADPQVRAVVLLIHLLEHNFLQ